MNMPPETTPPPEDLSEECVICGKRGGLTEHCLGCGAPPCIDCAPAAMADDPTELVVTPEITLAAVAACVKWPRHYRCYVCAQDNVFTRATLRVFLGKLADGWPACDMHQGQAVSEALRQLADPRTSVDCTARAFRVTVDERDEWQMDRTALWEVGKPSLPVALRGRVTELEAEADALRARVAELEAEAGALRKTAVAKLERQPLLSQQEVLVELRKLHKQYVRSCGSRFRDEPFRARIVPGWIYDPKTDTVRQVS